MSNLDKIFLFRMTHIQNVPHILEYGITHSKSLNANNSYQSIGDNSLISNRDSFEMPNGQTLGEYVPFYFGPRMPMLYVVQHGFNGVPAVTPENIIYCVSSVAKIIEQKLDFVFTDGHAIDSFSSFYNQSDITEIENIIDKKAISCRYWKDEKDLDLKRRKEAEFLVSNDIPREALIGFYTYNEKAGNKMIEFGIKEKIIVKPAYYF